MNKYYIHPELRDKGKPGPILDLQTSTFVTDAPYPLPDVQLDFEELSFDEYWKRLRDANEVRKSLKIPPMSYAAHSFPSRHYDATMLLDLIEWARERYETRWWVNHISALVLIAIADPDLTENAGWEFYEYGKDIPDRASFHAPAWWEFVQHGVLIPPTWDVYIGNSRVNCASPDGRYLMVIGAG